MNIQNSIKTAIYILFISIIISCNSVSSDSSSNPNSETNQVDFWLTNPDETKKLEKQNTILSFENSSNNYSTIEIDNSQTYQTIDGFGFSLTGGSVEVINQLSSSKKQALLQELFGSSENAIAVSYLRVSIGASDLNGSVFSYNDMPSGQTDTDLSEFSLNPDVPVINMLKEILAINPAIKIMGSPWSPPVWMKDNNSSIGGSLQPQYYGVYAQYFVKYIQQMKAEGINIDAITPQNEPLHPGNNPSMYMTAQDQASFIKKSLGPAFAAANIKTKIVIYDHNADRTDYPLQILSDPDAAKYVDGSAFHLYAGSIDDLSKVHAAYPDKNLYFTEQWVGGPGNLAEDLAWHVRTLIIGGTRNWCRNVLEWNMASDPQYNPHTSNGGCDRCLGTITINNSTVTRNPAYYVLAHASKFVRPGSVRISSALPGNLPNVAFKTPEGKKVLIVLNDNSASQQFNIKFKDRMVTTTLDKGAVGTYVW